MTNACFCTFWWHSVCFGWPKLARNWSGFVILEEDGWQGSKKKRQERDKKKAGRVNEWVRASERVVRVVRWGLQGTARGVWWTALLGRARSAERLSEGRRNGAHHYPAQGSTGRSLLQLAHPIRRMSFSQWNRADCRSADSCVKRVTAASDIQRPHLIW